MDLTAFGKSSPGILVPISGTAPSGKAWEHRAFLPDDLPAISPELSGAAYRCVAETRARLAALDSTALHLADSPLFRLPNVFLTPHIAGAIGTERLRLGQLAIEEIERFVSGQRLLHAVEPALLERLA